MQIVLPSLHAFSVACPGETEEETDRGETNMVKPWVDPVEAYCIHIGTGCGIKEYNMSIYMSQCVINIY